jgi:HTH-type transcriptional regulator / antitoxin HigA
MELRVIKGTADYEAALAQTERLVALDPAVSTPEADQLELLTVLIHDYEKRKFPFDAPDPISAIEFRMQEQGLRQKDLVPLLGSRSRVSEVLARKRPLTVPMIRSLSVGLGIPSDVLVGNSTSASRMPIASPDALDWSRFPAGEMRKRGWFDFGAGSKKRSTEELVKEFFKRITSEPTFALYRRRFHGEGFDEKARYSVLAWSARILMRAKNESADVAPFDPTKIDSDVLKDLARLSTFEAGPRLAVEFLAKRGISVIVEPRLPGTSLDGAALLTEQNHAVIGLTLRHDRIDAFWFTLLHEVAHVWRHLSSPDEAFVDRIEHADSADYREKEANRLARETFIPRAVWRRSNAFLSPTRENIHKLSEELRIHPGIVVGRLHFETGNYTSFTEFLRQGTIRRQFSRSAAG